MAAVGNWIVGPARNRAARRVAFEVVIIDFDRLLRPGGTGVLEIAEHLLLFGVHADRGQPRRLECLPHRLDVLELLVPVRAFHGGLFLVVDAQRIAHLFKQTADGSRGDVDLNPLQLRADLLRGSVRPLLISHRISGRVRRQHPTQRPDHSRRFFSYALRPPPDLRVRSTSTLPESNSRRPRATVAGLSSRSSAIQRSPPRPTFSASRPAYMRRCCSSNKLKKRTMAAFTLSVMLASSGVCSISLARRERICFRRVAESGEQ